MKTVLLALLIALFLIPCLAYRARLYNNNACAGDEPEEIVTFDSSSAGACVLLTRAYGNGTVIEEYYVKVSKACKRGQSTEWRETSKSDPTCSSVGGLEIGLPANGNCVSTVDGTVKVDCNSASMISVSSALLVLAFVIFLLQ